MQFVAGLRELFHDRAELVGSVGRVGFGLHELHGRGREFHQPGEFAARGREPDRRDHDDGERHPRHAHFAPPVSVTP